MSFSNYRDIKIFFMIIFLLAYTQYLPSVSGGMCWSKMSKQGYCKEILRSKISKEQCCNGEGVSTAYTPENLNDGQLFFWRVLGDGVPCKACKETCEGVICEKDRKCAFRKGRPTCVCAPKCKHLRNMKKGPVCGTDGITYKSVCRLKKRACRTRNRSLTINYHGSCQSRLPVETITPTIYDSFPHRTKDDSYSKKGYYPAAFSVSKGSTFDDKKCTSEQKYGAKGEPRNERPTERSRYICAAGGVRDSITVGSCKHVKCASGKYCVQDQNLNAHCVKCSQYCSLDGYSDYRKVCGTDGNTYRSMCYLREASCLKGKAIPVAYEGRCKSNATCDSIHCDQGQKCLLHKETNLPRCVPCNVCPKRKSVLTVRKEMGGPICGTNNQTYDSWCYMIEDSCKQGLVIETQFPGTCELGNTITDSLGNSILRKF